MPETVKRAAVTAVSLVPPRTPYEEAIVAIWRDVLHRSDVGVFDDFFDLDGHSLLAIQVVARIRRTLGVDLPVRDLFESPTVAGLAAAVTATLGRSPSRPEVTPRPPDAEPVLSFDQQRLWLEDQLRPGPRYNVHGRRRLLGPLDVAALERSIRAILIRHEALRTRFPVVDGRPVQWVDDADEDWRIQFEDLSGSDIDGDEAAHRLADQQAVTAFDLAHGPLFRCLLIKLGDTEHLLSITMHHIVSDAWSIGLFLRELAALYRAGGDISQVDLPDLPVQYRDFAVWQRRWLAGESLEAHLDYWRRRLAGSPPALSLPVTRRHSPTQGAVGGRLRSELSKEDTDAVHELCRNHGVTPFMAMQAGLAAVLSRWSGQQDVVIGTPVATRNDAWTDNLIGFFVNTLPLRIDLSGDPTFAELLGRVRQVALDGYAHGEAPFDVLVNELQPPRDPTRTPLFQVVLNMVDIAEESTQLAGLTVEPADIPVLPSKFDLNLHVRESDGALRFELAFHGDRYDTDMMRTLLTEFGALLRAVAADPEKDILEYPLQGPEPTAVPDPAHAHRPAPHLAVDRHALRRPDQVAVTDGAGPWTYRRLSRAADRVARALAERGADAPGDVAVVKRRDAGFVAAVLGCMKAGVPYSIVEAGAPDPTPRPSARIVLDPDPATTIAGDAIDLRGLLRDETDQRHPLTEPGPEPGPFPDWALERFALTADDRFAVLSGSSGQMMSALSTALSAGATLFIPDAATIGDVDALAEWLRANAVSVVYLSAPLVRAIATHDPAPVLPALRYAFVNNAGELTYHDASAVRHISPSCRCVGVYGTTGTGQPLTAFAVPDTWSPDTAPLRVPLGQEVDGVRADLLNPAGRSAATGEVGEICFAANRTGDLGRRLTDGNLEITGRAGTTAVTAHHHADPAETVAVLRDLPQVRDAMVTEYVDIAGRATLTAYVASRDPEPSTAELRRYLTTQLPEYLVPEYLVVLDRLPLTLDGEYDLAALPDPGWDGEHPETYVAPRTPVERRLTEIFEELLDVERVGVHDTFFDLSGFSLLATQLATRIRETFRCELSLREVFESPTVEGLAQLIVAAQAELADPGDLEALLDGIE
jgi:non-ribosomal peptide synthetase component F/acyl carrier protein